MGVLKTDSGLVIYADNNGDVTNGPNLKGKNVYLRIKPDLINNDTMLQYSLDGNSFVNLGKKCILSNFNYWKAVRPALYSYNLQRDAGKAFFDWFVYQHDGPLGGL